VEIHKLPSRHLKAPRGAKRGTEIHRAAQPNCLQHITENVGARHIVLLRLQPILPSFRVQQLFGAIPRNFRVELLAFVHIIKEHEQLAIVHFESARISWDFLSSISHCERTTT
jgi:hypothetical protein